MSIGRACSQEGHELPTDPWQCRRRQPNVCSTPRGRPMSPRLGSKPFNFPPISCSHTTTSPLVVELRSVTLRALVWLDAKSSDITPPSGGCRPSLPPPGGRLSPSPPFPPFSLPSPPAQGRPCWSLVGQRHPPSWGSSMASTRVSSPLCQMTAMRSNPGTSYKLQRPNTDVEKMCARVVAALLLCVIMMSLLRQCVRAQQQRPRARRSILPGPSSSTGSHHIHPHVFVSQYTGSCFAPPLSANSQFGHTRTHQGRGSVELSSS